MTKKTEEKVRVYLHENLNVAVDVAREINGWDGSFPEFDSVELEEFVSWYSHDANALVEILLNSLDNLSSDTEMIRVSDYNEIEEITDEDLENEVVDYIDDIIEKLDELYPSKVSIYYDDDLKEILDADEDDEEDDNE